MLLSRFWYVLLGLVLGVLVFMLYLAASMYNRQGSRVMAEGLSIDSQVVSWYLKNDSRERSAHLIKFALDGNIAKYLSDSSGAESKVPEKAREKIQESLTKVAGTIAKEQSFDAVFAVDQHGRVVAHLGYEQATGMEDFELGGYPVVADALHGFVRDDTLVLDRVYRVVARPVEYDLGSAPAGAIVGARIIDDRFARDLANRTGAAVAFYAHGERVASGSPEGFDRSQLDVVINDLKSAEQDADYKAKGRSSLRVITNSLGAVYARLPGEAWDLGAGYVVGRSVTIIDSPIAFFGAADDKDKKSAKIPIVAGIVLLAAGLGLLFSFFEYSKPMALFRAEAHKLGKGQEHALAPSKFRGVLRTIASDINDALDVAVGKGGGTRRAADLQQVLGDIPAEPQMSAFSFPGDSAAAPTPPKPKPPSPKSGPGAGGPPSAPSNPRATRSSQDDDVVTSAPSRDDFGGSPAPKKALPAPPPRPGVPSAPRDSSPEPAQNQDVEWRRVFDEFASTKQQCGESLDGFTYEKFQNTLKKHHDAIVDRHGVKKVKFSVYVKDGKAALKASPIRD